MARYLYGGTAADVTTTQAGRLVAGATLTVWDSQTGGTQITDLQDATGTAATVVTSDAYGRVLFYGPDNDTRSFWLESNVGGRVLVRPAMSISPAANQAMYNVKDFGAVGDGTTDDSAAITAAITAAAAVKGQLVFPAVASGYKITSPISVPESIDVLMYAPILYAGAANTTALTINPSANYAFRRLYRLWVHGVTTSDWTSETSVGILLRNIDCCDVTIVEATNFTIGVKCLADDHGFAYTKVDLGHINNNKIGVALSTAGSGWVNENTVYGGNFSCGTGINLTTSRYGIRVGDTSNTYIPNGNVFYRPSFEIDPGSMSGGAEAVPVWIRNGQNIRVYDMRDESGTGTVAVRAQNDSEENLITSAYDARTGSAPLTSVVDDTSTQATTMYEPGFRPSWRACSRLVAAFPALHKTAVPYDATYTNVPGMMIGSTSNANRFRALDGLTIGTDYLTVSSGRTLGIFIDTRVAKRFLVAADTESGYGGRVMIRCYDSSGNVLDPASYTSQPLTKGFGYESADWGKVRVSGSDSNQPVHFVVTNPIVHHICLMVGQGSADLRISALRIYTDAPSSPAVWTDYPENAVDPVATQAPASGTWTVGQKIYNGAPGAGSPLGWVCTVAGTPGTWKAMANLS